MTTPSDTRPGSPDGPLWDPEAIPAATVIVLRDGAAGLEVLMLRRDRDLAFAGGMWVFPGGRIDSEDLEVASGPSADEIEEAHALARATAALRAEIDPQAPPEPDPVPEPVHLFADLDLLERAARVAAVREAAEEAGLVIDEPALRRWSHWTPPPQTPKRFTTAFFVAPLGDGSGEVVIDDAEIREHRWQRPVDVMEDRDAGIVGLTPPTFITLCQLSSRATVAEVMGAADDLAEHHQVEHFATRIEAVDAEVVAMYHGDAGYDTGDAAASGARHRLWMGSTWRYERDA